jgi:hypothetical protein
MPQPSSITAIATSVSAQSRTESNGRAAAGPQCLLDLGSAGVILHHGGVFVRIAQNGARRGNDGQSRCAFAATGEPLAWSVQAVRPLGVQDRADLLGCDPGKLIECLANLTVIDLAEITTAVGGDRHHRHQRHHQIAWIELPD